MGSTDPGGKVARELELRREIRLNGDSIGLGDWLQPGDHIHLRASALRRHKKKEASKDREAKRSEGRNSHGSPRMSRFTWMREPCKVSRSIQSDARSNNDEVHARAHKSAWL